MSAKRRKKPEARPAELVAAASRVFAEKGVATSSVSDIVKAAGVAQGTFYLYFASKNDVINAVVDQIADGMVDGIERAVAATNTGAVAKLAALRDEILAATDDRKTRELAEVYHRPENRAVHDRMAERLLPRLVPLVEGIVKAGVEEGVFAAADPRAAAWFVLGGLHAIEMAFRDRRQLGDAIVEATDCALRALGCSATKPGKAAQSSPRRRSRAR